MKVTKNVVHYTFVLVLFPRVTGGGVCLPWTWFVVEVQRQHKSDLPCGGIKLQRICYGSVHLLGRRITMVQFAPMHI